MHYFLGEISRQRNAEETEIRQSAEHAAARMVTEGISAVGDISNTAVTVEVKRNSAIDFFTFVETYGFSPSRAEKAFETALSVWSAYKRYGLKASVVPHSPYSVSRELFRKLTALDAGYTSILTIHNQESEAENCFFRSGVGPIRDHLEQNLGLDTTDWRPSGKSSLETILPGLNPQCPLLLVHNTYTTLTDIEILKTLRPEGNYHLVLCPNSNLFIENRLPPVELFRSEALRICTGTDSLASNSALSVLEELKTIQKHFPGIPSEELFTWACLNGAEALGYEGKLGSLKAGKKPGIVLITPVNPSDCSLTPDSRAVRLA
jgi:cytosine/adenosine deaminase-related metal-dependent hydrolase